MADLVKNPLDMTDEELAATSAADFENEDDSNADTDTDDSAVEQDSTDLEAEENQDLEEESDVDATEDSPDDVEADADGEVDESGDPATEEDDQENDKEPGKVEPDSDEDDSDTKSNKDKDTEELDSPEEIDYKSEYEKILQPFKANGKDMHLKNIEDVRTLMQMGANYNKKMATIKPQLKIIKMLDNNGLLDESKLSYLIDLEKKNPEAIKKLLQDSKIDPLDIDVSEEAKYQPNDYSASDGEVALDSVLEDIRDSESYDTTIDIVSNKWDKQSQGAIAQDPMILKQIHEHVDTGIYQIVASEVERERVLGRLNGVSDIEAYRQIGDRINARGGFAEVLKQPKQTQPVSKSQPNNVNATKSEDPKRASRKKAAGSTKGTAVKAKKGSDFNPLNMTDEEFDKLGDDKFI